MPSLSELVGNLKSNTDLSSEQVKVRYNESSSITGSSGKKILLKFPKIPGKFLNLASLKLHFTVETSSDSFFDTFSYSSIFQRIRVLSSSNVLFDCSDYGTLATTLKHAKTNVNTENKQHRLNEGVFASVLESQTAAAGTQRISLCFPHGTILNCDSLLPLDRLSGHFSIELYLQDPRKILGSATNDLSSNYTLHDLQLVCSYISSPTLSSFFESNPVNFHVDNWSHRFQPVSDAKSVLRIPSAYTSLAKLLVCIRDQSVVDSTNTLNATDRQQCFRAYSEIQEIQFWSNNQPLWSEPIVLDNVTTELFNETVQTLPELVHSTFQNSVVTSAAQIGSVPIGVNLSSAPVKFHKELISGIKSSSHVSDLYSVISWKNGVVFTDYAATVFLMNESRVFVDSNGALQIEY